MKTTALSLICICLIAIAAVTVCFTFLTREKQNIKYLKEEVKRSTHNLDMIENNALMLFGSGFEKISENITLKDNNNNAVNLNDIIKRSKFIIRITGFGCTPCLENFYNDLPELKKRIDIIGWDNTIILLSSDNPRDITAFQKIHDISAEIFIMPPMVSITNIEKSNYVPPFYYMILDENMRSLGCYFPIQGVDKVNNAYFNSVIRYFTDID